MTPISDVAILVVAKAPRPGAVKTRLAADLGELGAARVAAAALADTLVVAGAAFEHRVLALDGDLSDTGAVDVDEISDLLTGWQVIDQVVGDFGHRLAKAHIAAALAVHRSSGSVLPVLQIGMDTPQVSGPLLQNCARLLVESDVDAVLGPAEDGGWWICGTSDPQQASCLSGVQMSRADTGVRTLAALQALGSRVGLTPELRDLDTLDDAKVIATDHGRLRVSLELRSQGVA